MTADRHAEQPAGPTPQPSTGSPPAEVRRVAISSYLGSTIEFYDFILYTSAAAIVFGPLFFSSLSPAAATLASFATLAAGYVARPLGGIVLAHAGDRVGRKRVLVFTMVVMGVASGAIGLLPTYDQIGAAAPLLLVTLRLLQGFAVGGEWGGAVVLAAEHAPPKQRGFITAIVQTGQPSGGLLSALALGAVTFLPEPHFMSWGWRIPFLISFALLVIGLYVRMKVGESPLFNDLDAAAKRKETPLVGVLRRPGPLLRGFAVSVPSAAAATLIGSFAVSYAVNLGTPRSTALSALTVAWAGAIVMCPIYGMLSDRLGRRPVFTASAAAFAVLGYPMFWAIGSGSTLLLFVAFFVAFALISVCMSSAIGALLSEMFPTEIRYTGISTAYQLSHVLAGFVPLIASGLLALGGGGRNIGWLVAFVVAFNVIALAALWSGSESKGRDLRTVEAPTGKGEAPQAAPVGLPD